ncbi:hypothetical protein [Nostoc sp. UHCC 0870]|uniref:hypothetical protein n=1 Tax=Nostoc sp. UHCC 0870 TaxID=2914041 RepID=UPI001EDC9F99|nr:hypothetical protein [Nostoc sp. UHCC 0870]UKO97455.1 hypothetical protein L6494_23230 [Nostoc sp. UHCC 0870]
MKPKLKIPSTSELLPLKLLKFRLVWLLNISVMLTLVVNALFNTNLLLMLMPLPPKISSLAASK